MKPDVLVRRRQGNIPNVMVWILISAILLGQCECPPKTEKKESPHLIIIGEDLSGTFDQFPQTTEDDLRELCDSLAKSKTGGKVYFIGIGNATPKGYAVCEIKPILKVNKSKPVSDQLKMKRRNKKIKEKNAAATEQFVLKAMQIFSERKQGYTDINGFFEKVSSIISDPNHTNYTKWLYVNSDGKHDTKISKKIDCNLLPGADYYYVSRGWKAREDCGALGKLLDTHHFVEQLTKQIKASRLAD